MISHDLVQGAGYSETDKFHNKSDHSWRLVIRFFKLLSLHCREVRDVRFYADKLSITTTYLYKLCKKYMLLPPKELIDKQTVTEIKSFLINTDMTVKSITSELHFDDVSYMCRYFRRLTGVSPTDYRLNYKSTLMAKWASPFRFPLLAGFPKSGIFMISMRVLPSPKDRKYDVNFFAGFVYLSPHDRLKYFR